MQTVVGMMLYSPLKTPSELTTFLCVYNVDLIALTRPESPRATGVFRILERPSTGGGAADQLKIESVLSL